MAPGGDFFATAAADHQVQNYNVFHLIYIYILCVRIYIHIYLYIYIYIYVYIYIEPRTIIQPATTKVSTKIKLSCA